MSRRRGVTSRQVDRIRELSHTKMNTVQIQRTLSREKIGLRRTVMLGYVREFRNKQPRANVSRYAPIKYSGIGFSRFGRGIACYGSQFNVSKRVQLSGSGKSMGEAMRIVIKRPPKDRYAFLNIDADTLLANPDKYLDKRGWDSDRPKIKSR